MECSLQELAYAAMNMGYAAAGSKSARKSITAWQAPQIRSWQEIQQFRRHMWKPCKDIDARACAQGIKVKGHLDMSTAELLRKSSELEQRIVHISQAAAAKLVESDKLRECEKKAWTERIAQLVAENEYLKVQNRNLATLNANQSACEIACMAHMAAIAPIRLRKEEGPAATMARNKHQIRKCSFQAWSPHDADPRQDATVQMSDAQQESQPLQRQAVTHERPKNMIDICSLKRARNAYLLPQ